jgi:acyl carrier protein
MESPMNTAIPGVASNGIEVKIRDFVARNFLFVEEGFSLKDDASFLKQGVIDSLGVVELVSFTGQEFGVRVEPAEVTPANFDSVSCLAAYIRRKQAVNGGARARA